MIGNDFSSEIEALDFLDFSVSFGRPPVPFTGAWVDKAGLRAEMKRMGIRQAAPYHILSKSYDADYGNKLILEELKDAPELIPTWAAVPSEEGMGCSPCAFADMFEKSGAKVVRLFPSSTGNPRHRHPIRFRKMVLRGLSGRTAEAANSHCARVFPWPARRTGLG